MPYLARVYPISLMVWRTRPAISTYASVVISPKTSTVPGAESGLAGDPAERVPAQHGVEDRVTDLVGHLVRVPLRDRFGGEQTVTHCWHLEPALHPTGSHRAALCGSGLLLSGDRTIVPAPS